MSDITPPVLTSLTLPSIIDLSKGAGSFAFSAGARDEDGGSGVDRVVLYFDKSVATSFGTTSNWYIGGALDTSADNYNDATPGSGSNPLTLTTATAPGTYNVTSVYVYDVAGNLKSYTADELKALGMNTSFMVTGTTADTVAPTLDGLNIPTTVDLSKGAQAVSFGASAHDNAGGTGIDRVVLYFDNNLASSYGVTGSVTIGGALSFGGDNYADTTPASGAESLTLTTATAPGTYHVGQVIVYDLAGNSTRYTGDALKAQGIDTAFTVTGTTADTTPPVLERLSLPATVDISAGKQTLTFGAFAHDDAAGKGVDRVVLYFDHSLATSYGSAGSVTIGGVLAFNGDTFSDATPTSASTTTTVTAAAALGTYSISSAYVYDLAGNLTTYTTSQLRALGIATQFTVTDGTTPAAPSATSSVAINGSKITLDLASADWKSGSNSFSLSIKYDAGAMHYDSTSLLGNGASSLSVQVSEFGSVGTLTLSGSGASDVLAGKDFLAAVFQSDGGTAHYSIDSFTLNGKVQTLGATQVGNVGPGSANADVLYAATGAGYYDGGAGIDTVNFGGASVNYSIAATTGGYTITDNSGNNAVLHNVERLNFSDKSLALDLNGNAGQIYRLYQAAFDREPDLGGIGFWLSHMDKGMSLLDVGKGFMTSPEFATLYGGANPSNDVFINALYQNVLHRTPDQSGFDFYMDALNGGVSRQQVLAGFSESPENQAAVIGAIQHGIAYTPLI